ncbi:MAG: glycosyltransferase family 4 protein [Eggerthellaceae bacterium]|jgi:UDP-GlcNAc:undecaprenyl-phosphate GlcNAc-1-phosphate transferase
MSLSISWVLMPPFIKLMTKFKILDKAGGRKIHDGYTAHMGGIIIYIAIAVSVLAMSFVYRGECSWTLLLFIGVVVTIMLLVGIRDDLHNISAWHKLFFEIAVGIFMSYAGIKLTNLNGFLGIYQIPEWAGYLITTLVFILIVNAFNLIDGIDGQAGLQALNFFFFCGLFLTTVLNKDIDTTSSVSPLFVYICCVAIIGAILGYLRYNWQPAQIFMGDAGSLLIGTLITIFLIICIKYNFAVHQMPDHFFTATIAPFFYFFYIPIADTVRVFFYRARHGRSPFCPDNAHIHYLLLNKGFSHQRCALTLFFTSVAISIAGIVLSVYFDDNICVAIYVISWFIYLGLIHKFLMKPLAKTKEQNS